MCKEYMYDIIHTGHTLVCMWTRCMQNRKMAKGNFIRRIEVRNSLIKHVGRKGGKNQNANIQAMLSLLLFLDKQATISQLAKG